MFDIRLRGVPERNVTLRQYDGTLIRMNRNQLKTTVPPISMPIRTLFGLMLGLALFVRVQSLSTQPAKVSLNSSSTVNSRTEAIGDKYATPRVATGQLDTLGRPITISCASCHANFEPNTSIRTGEQLEQFHQGLKFAHGNLTCLSCHHSKNYNWLRLASDQPLDYSQSQTLCSQCHSKQHKDYEHGAHGGMNGHWNTERGGRVRKQCIDCHDPHSPAFPAMIPTFRSRDRFLEPSHEKHRGIADE